jgi:hypothetical protein
MKRFVTLLLSLLLTWSSFAQVGSIAATTNNTNTFTPVTIQSKFAGWWKGETGTYLIDQLGYQEREALSQNSIAGQLFDGRAIKYESASDYSFVSDNGALDIGTPPLSMSFWIYWDTFTGFSRIAIGKYVNGTTSGEYYFTTGSNSLSFNCRTSAGIVTVGNIITSATTGVWYHIIVNINDDGKVYAYRNKTVLGSTPSWTGTFAPISNIYSFCVNTINSLTSSLTGYGAIRVRDLRLFRKNLTSQERTDCYNGKYVSGFLEWWPMSDNSTLRTHSAKSSGKHLTNVSFAASNFVTGTWRQIYNEYGYAQDATYGQIPPSLTSLASATDIPTVDCYGNALVFKGSAKINLVKSGSNYVLPTLNSYYIPYERIRYATDVVGLNQWFSGTTPQAVPATSVATYNASRQFYNDVTKELILVKSDSYFDNADTENAEHLTAVEESGLMYYLGNPPIPTTYHANTTSLIARFTNTYTNKEKSRIDNVMRLLVRNNIYTKLEGFVLAATSGLEEQKLDWINASYNVVTAGVGAVSQLPYRGLAPQKGNYRNGFVPSAGTKFLQNDCFMSFKVALDNRIPMASNALIGSEITSTSVTIASFSFGTNGNAHRTLTMALNSTGNGANAVLDNFNVETNRTFVGNRSSSTTQNLVAKRQEIGTTSAWASTARNSTEWYIGNKHFSNGTRYISLNNFIQHYSFGSALTQTESTLLALIVDNFCDGQLALADEWIQNAGFQYKIENKVFLDRLGEQVIWSDYNYLYYSTDGGKTVTSSVAFDCTTLGWVHMAHIFDNGKIVLGTFKNKFYKTTSTLSSLTEIIPTKNGVTYTPHTPVSTTYPGEYTKFLGINKKFYKTDGTEIFIYTNYGTSLRGACPTLVWYSFGDEMKVAYEFGTNPYVRDNGTGNGGSTGTFLGDASVLNWARHGHGIQQRPDDKTKYILMTGDLDRAALSPASSSFFECKFMQLAYNEVADTWTSTLIKDGNQSSRWKATSGQMPGDGYIYWSSDAGITGSNQAELGYFKSPLSTFGTSGDVRFYTPLNLTKPSNMFHLEDGFFMGGGYAATGAPSGGFFESPNIIWSNDMSTFHEVVLDAPGDVYFFKITKIAGLQYQLDAMPDYDFFAGCYSIIIRFN